MCSKGGFHLYLFDLPFIYISIYLVSSIIALVPNAFELEWQLKLLNDTSHGLRTPNEGINQRYLKNWADVADKICFSRT